MLEENEVKELESLAHELQRPNPLLPAMAAVIAKFVVVNTQGKILILWRSDKTPMPGRVDLPSGGVDYGENPIDGVIREAKDEAGLDVANVQIAETFGYLLQDR